MDTREPDRTDSADNGLHLLNNPRLSTDSDNAIYAADIVFVHGLNGHWTKTWTHANGTFWPKDLLPHALPGACIYSYGYPSQIFANKSVAGIRDFAKHLLGDLSVCLRDSVSTVIHVTFGHSGLIS